MKWNEQEEWIIKNCPQIMKATKINARAIGKLCYKKLRNLRFYCAKEKEWLTWRGKAGCIANILNKRLGTDFEYLDFYLIS